MFDTGQISCCCAKSMRSPWLAAVFVAGMAVPVTVFSQETPDSRPEPLPLDEVIVTARKVEESVQSVPMSLQVLSAELLDDLDLSRLIDLQFNVPGLVVSNLGLNGAGFSLRGVADQGGSSLAVATHLNGVYMGTSQLAIARMFDLQRVEILKGPQGTLYGRNATGGSINIITQAPANETSADIELAYGSFDTRRVQGHVNLPFGRSAFRLAYIGSEGDGFIRNSVDDRKFAENDFWGLRASWLIDVSDNLQIDVVAQRVADDGASGELWLPQPDNLADPSDIHLTTVTLADPFLKTEGDNLSVNIEYDLGPASFRSITGYADSDVQDVDDCAGLPRLQGCVRSALPSRDDQWSQEFQLVSTAGSSIDWLVGAHYYELKESRDYFQFTPVIDPNPTFDQLSASRRTAYAVFGQARWHFHEAWSITGGLRLNYEDYWKSEIGTGTEDSPTLVTAEDEWDGVSWRVDLEYDLADDALLYAGISTGFKSGGITILPGGVLDSFAPEDLTAYEAGIKANWLDRNLTFNGAAFYYDFRDLQVTTFTITESGFIFETDNAAKAEIYGIDADGTLRISDRLVVNGGLVWLPKRDFVEYRNDRFGDTLSGNKLTRSPEWTVTAAIDYDYPLRAHGIFSARLEYNYRSDFFYTTSNIPQFAQDSFDLVNIFLKYESRSEKWYLFSSGRNLGDVDYFNQVFLQSSPGYPRTYELGFGYRI
jgi:iron complex outermembrane receptor protein